MASVSSVAVSLIPTTSASTRGPKVSPSRGGTTVRLPAKSLRVCASSSPTKERAVAGLTAAVVAAKFVIPEVAEAAKTGLSPSLKNFLLSIVYGGVVLAVIVGAVVAVANFDPVKRR